MSSVNPYQEGKTSYNQEDKTDNQKCTEQVTFHNSGQDVTPLLFLIHIEESDY